MRQLREVSRRSARSVRRPFGFTLIELMVAMALGLLVSAGIVTAFMATSKSSKVQNALARVQENGRYAMTRFESDLRMYGAQFRSGNSGAGYQENASSAPVGAAYPRTSYMLNTTRTTFVPPDGGGATNPVMNGWPVNAFSPISARFMGQGYDCPGTTCTPAVPTGPIGLPAAALAVEARLPGADVLSIRYQRGTGWAFTPSAPTVVPITLTLTPAVGDDPVNFQSGDFALVSMCTGSQIVAVNASGNVLTVVDLKAPDFFIPRSSNPDCDIRVFNASRDWNTVTYWLKLIDDPNPQAPANRMLPVLMRSDNGVSEELVQGVERLDFLYSVADAGGMIRFLTAAEMDAQSNALGCPMPAVEFEAISGGVATWREPGCLWRAVRGVEVHALLNTIDNQFDLAAADTAYRYSIDTGTTPAAPTGTTMPATGLPNGVMMRREFTTYVSIRNGTY